MQNRASHESGFTLVETLIALSAFALIAMGGTALINISLASQEQLERASQQTRALQRLQAVLRADFGQMVERQSRTQAGEYKAGLSLNSADTLIEFAQLGRLRDPAAPRPSLEKVRYFVDGGVLYRARYRYADGAAAARPAALLEDVEAAEALVFSAGAWRAADLLGPLPQAVELRLTHRDYGLLQLKYLTPGNAASAAAPEL
ncbi:MAG: type II secretion system minor pseudopilin GspJ [Pseudomonadota bacterium]